MPVIRQLAGFAPRHRRLLRLTTTLLAITLLGLAASSASSRGAGPEGKHADQRSTKAVQFPLEVSRDGRYLVDQRGVPFMIVGDSPQALIGRLNLNDVRAFISNRRAAGYNSFWVNLLCVEYTGCDKSGATFEGIKPFTSTGDLSKPNPLYFARAAQVLRLAARAGIAVFLDPIETGGWLDVLRKNGTAKARAYGRFLGQRFKALGNIVWWNGNDFQSWRQSSDDAVVLAVAQGIASVDKKHLQTIELDYPRSSSRDDARWRSLIGLDAAYTYLPTYAEVLKEYKRKPPMPVFMAEAGYEFEQNTSSISKGVPSVLRRQEYWSALSGAAGQFYGNHFTWQFIDGWKDNLDTPGSIQFGYVVKLLTQGPWFRLVPDDDHKLVISGYGRFATTGNVESSDYVTTAATRDGTWAVSYLPAGGTLVIDMSRMAGRVVARWYDPAKGTFSPVAGSPFSNSGRVTLTSPPKNGDGEADWVLVLTSQ